MTASPASGSSRKASLKPSAELASTTSVAEPSTFVGQRQRLPGPLAGVGVPAQVQQQLGQAGGGGGPLPGGAVRGLQRPLVLRLGRRGPTGGGQVAGPADVQRAARLAAAAASASSSSRASARACSPQWWAASAACSSSSTRSTVERSPRRSGSASCNAADQCRCASA